MQEMKSTMNDSLTSTAGRTSTDSNVMVKKKRKWKFNVWLITPVKTVSHQAQSNTQPSNQSTKVDVLVKLCD
jgi:hypothetical protein